jgi:hypothetical protein
MTKYSNALQPLPFLWVAQQLNQSQKKKTRAPFIWEAASVYFLMTDRFYNGDKSNDNKTTGKNYVVLKEVILKESQKKEFISINWNHNL